VRVAVELLDRGAIPVGEYKNAPHLRRRGEQPLVTPQPESPTLDGIDVHVHVEKDLHGHLSMDDELLTAAAKYFKGEMHHPTVPEIAEHYRGHHLAAVISFTVD
jgi:hypothetical protein